jgi:MoaA/NifB/PqqE/SkfB family radical SAM enzyme
MNKWFDVSQIGRIQIELTNYCNAACSQCDRYEQYIDWKKGKIAKLDLNNKWFTLTDIKQILGSYKWDSLDHIHFCGNVDEPTINPEMIEITEYFLTLSPRAVGISTNGGTRDEKFWTELGKLSNKTKQVYVVFGLDGLEDTNHIYRRNVRWEVVQRNWRAYIKSGGWAEWQFIVFDHNKHQLDLAKKLADEEGFGNFRIVHSGRSEVEVLDTESESKKPLVIKHDKVEIPNWYKNKYGNKIDGVSFEEFKNKTTVLESVRCPAKLNSNINKFHETKGNIYISAKGYVTPCCWMGNPRELIQLWNSAPHLNPVTHNIFYNSLQDIINGDWFKHIDDQMQNYKLCVFKCKELNGDIHL